MIEDSLGRQVDAGGLSLADCASFIKSMMAGKTTQQPIPETAKTKDTSSGAKEIFDLMKRLNQNISEQFSQSKAYLDQVVNLVKNSASPKTANTNGINIGVEKLSTSIAEQGKKNELLSGSMMTTSDALKSCTQTVAQLDRTMNSALSLMRIAMVAAMKMMAGGNKGEPGAMGKEASKELADINKTEKSTAVLQKTQGGKLAQMAEHGLKKGSIFTHDVRLEQIIKELNLNQMKYNASSKTTTDKTNFLLERQRLRQEQYHLESQKYQASKGPSLTAGITGKIMDAIGKVAVMGRKATGAPSVTETVMGGHAGGPVEAFTGMMEEQSKLAIEAKQIAYETQGITGDTKKLQEEYLLLEDSAMKTGVARLDLQKRLLQFQRMGVKDQTTLKDITVTTVAAEKQLGLEAGALGDDFLKLHQEAGFTKGQINQTAKGMMDVARSSGLSGNELKKAMDSSKGVVQNMKNAATLTADAIKNVTSVMAEAQKLGVTEQLSSLLNAASTSSNIFLKASSETKTLLFQAAGSVGKIADLQNGVLLKSKDGMKSLGVGMDNILKRFGVSGVDAIENMSDQAKARLNIQLQSVYKMDLGEFVRSAKALKEGAKGYNERLAEIDEQIKNNGNTQLGIEAKRNAELKKAALLQEASGSVMNLFEESLKGAGTGAAGMQKAMEKFNTQLNKNKDMQQAVEALRSKKQAAGTLTQADTPLSLAIENSMESLQKKLTDVGLGEKAKQLDPAMIAEAMGDKDKFQALQDTMQKLEQEAAAKEKAMTDPATQAQYEMLKVNDKISQTAMITSEYTKNLLGSSGLIALSAAEYLIQTIKNGGILTEMLGVLMSLGGNIINGIISALGSLASSIITGISSLGSSLMTGLTSSMAGSVGAGMTALAKKIPIIGGVVDFGKRLYEGEGVAKAATGAGTTMATAAAFGAAGAALGGPLAPITGLIGSIVGAFVGSGLGDIAYEYLVEPVLNAITSFGSNLGTILVDYVWKPFVKFFSWLGSSIWTLFMDYYWKPLVNFWTWLGSKVMSIFTDYIWKPLVSFFTWLGTTAIGGLFMDYIWTPYVNFWIWVGTTISGLFMDYIWNPIANFFGWVGGSVGQMFMDYLWNPFVNFWSWVGSSIGSFFTDWIFTPIATKFTELGTKLGEIGTWLMDTLLWPFKKVYEWLGGWGPSLWNWIKSVAAKIPIVGKYLVGGETAETPAATPPAPPTATAMTTAAANPALIQAQQMKANVVAQTAAATNLIAGATGAASRATMSTGMQNALAYANYGDKITPVSVSAAPSISSPMMPLGQTMAATRAGTTAAAGGQSGAGFSQLAKVGESELEVARQQVDLLAKILASLTTGGSGASGGTTNTKPTSGGTDNYFKLPTGNFNESSIREVTNL